ncbi:hypothetical protein L484_021436 [Morus notabilis]|uniref:Uncharacterized protein n=1 Tax=Morus notabilis TaxID=981085 RepID=W9S071_9ROSA|nr:uncharacterized protein LOC21404293 [Morus notabilis]EXC01798.1 hypothetical protein L484_021436 [Morus notabilis]
MSRWSLAIKKLSPAKKAWKSFVTKIQPHLRKLIKNTLPKAIRAATHRLLISFRSFLPAKLRPISNSRRSYHNTNNHYCSRQYYYQNKNKSPLYKSFAAIHIDELFEGTTTTTTKNKNILRDCNTMHAEAGTSADNNNNIIIIIKEGKKAVDQVHYEYNNDRDHDERDLQRTESIYSVEDAWKAVVAASPQLRCVDERAEEFIYKVRQDMRLQKEKSLVDFEEMLARST